MPTLRALLLALAALILCKQPASAFDLFATHEVSVQFATQDGKPMANAEVEVYAPGNPDRVVKTGRTDKDGKFAFGTDRDGLWTAVAHSSSEVARATIRVGAGSDEQAGPSPYLVIGGLAVLLVLAVWYRYLRARSRRPRP